MSDPSLDYVRRHALGSDAVVYSALNSLGDRMTTQERQRQPFRFFGPYSTGSISVAAGADNRYDLPIDPIAYQAATNAPSKVLVYGHIIGYSGYYDWLHTSSTFTAVTNNISWYINNRGAGTAILYFNCAIIAFF